MVGKCRVVCDQAARSKRGEGLEQRATDACLFHDVAICLTDGCTIDFGMITEASKKFFSARGIPSQEFEASRERRSKVRVCKTIQVNEESHYRVIEKTKLPDCVALCLYLARMIVGKEKHVGHHAGGNDEIAEYLLSFGRQFFTALP